MMSPVLCSTYNRKMAFLKNESYIGDFHLISTRKNVLLRSKKMKQMHFFKHPQCPLKSKKIGDVATLFLK